MPPFQRIEPSTGNDAAARRLLSHVDLDPYSPTRGCFDRRFWAWKLVDFPEATYQRAVKPLAMLYSTRGSGLYQDERVRDAVVEGIGFAARIQHSNGSFDQAFPFEQSFGATAFLLHSIGGAVEILRAAGELEPPDETMAAQCLRKAAGFLQHAGERHGRITNHLAGAVAGLLQSELLLNEPAFGGTGRALLSEILDSQSEEGWFPEYEGPDPGYQTLSVHYLSDTLRMNPDSRLEKALDRAVDFLADFVHPDGSFGGEYGSRRTALFHPGGVARLSNRNPLAGAVLAAFNRGLAEGRTPGPADVDFGNLAPTLENHILAEEVGRPAATAQELPCRTAGYRRDHVQAGLFVRGTDRYFAVLGALTGGVLKVFHRDGELLFDDGGYMARIGNRDYSTQSTGTARVLRNNATQIVLEAPFHRVPRALPSPGRFLLLRLLNLTVMRSIGLGNLIKKLLVRLLITGKQRAPLVLERTIHFGEAGVRIEDRIHGRPGMRIESLQVGAPFRGVHMASAGYSWPAERIIRPKQVDLGPLLSSGEVRVSTDIAAPAYARTGARPSRVRQGDHRA